MSDEESLQKHHEESDSEEEEDQLEDVPNVDIDVTKLTPLSPEVISKQVSKQFSFIDQDQLIDGDLSRLQLTWVRVAPRGDMIQHLNYLYRNDRSCRTRKIDSRESHIRRHDCAIQK
jgi:hypothetical protein